MPEGKEVPEGTVLLQLDDDQARNDLAQAKLALEVAKEKLVMAKNLEEQRPHQIAGQEAAVKAALAKEEAAQEQSDRADRLFTTGLDGSEQNRNAAKALVKQAAAAVEGERSKLALVRATNLASAITLAETDIVSTQRQIENPHILGNFIRQ